MIQDHGTALGKSHLEKIPGDVQKRWEDTIKYKFLKTYMRSCNTLWRKEQKKTFISFFHLDEHSHCSVVHKPSSTQTEIIGM